jgi:hypothetical protein
VLPKEDLLKMLRESYEEVGAEEIPYKRFKAQKIKGAADQVTEYLFWGRQRKPKATEDDADQLSLPMSNLSVKP